MRSCARSGRSDTCTSLRILRRVRCWPVSAVLRRATVVAESTAGRSPEGSTAAPSTCTISAWRAPRTRRPAACCRSRLRWSCLHSSGSGPASTCGVRPFQTSERYPATRTLSLRRHMLQPAAEPVCAGLGQEVVQVQGRVAAVQRVLRAVPVLVRLLRAHARIVRPARRAACAGARRRTAAPCVATLRDHAVLGLGLG